jgi:hypothetical protein
MTPQQVIDEARVLINDDNPLMAERFSDADLLGYVNQAVKRACAVRPDLFVVSATITPTADQVEQELSASVTRLMEIHRVVGGGAVGEVDKETMDRSYPNWTTDTASAPVNWMRHPRNPRRYFLYPRPATGTQLAAEYIQVPSDYALGDTIAMSDSYKTALIDCVVFLAEVIDNEHVLTERAKEFLRSFMQQLEGDYMQRRLVDSEDAAIEEPQQRRGR